MVSTRSLLLLLFTLTLLPGCWLDGSSTLHDGTLTDTVDLPAGSPAEQMGVLRLVNHHEADDGYLHDVVGLDIYAASAIADRRAGPDGHDLTDDDELFVATDELEDELGLTLRAMDMLLDAAYAEDLVPVRSIEGVLFSNKELADTLEFVNVADEDELESMGLDRRARQAIVPLRPFDSMLDVADAPNVGPTALQDLRDHIVVLRGGTAA